MKKGTHSLDLSSEKETIVLKYISFDTFLSSKVKLDSAFKATELTEMINSLRKWLPLKNVLQINAEGKQESCNYISTYYTQKSHNKEDSLNFLATLLANSHNCKLLFQSFPNELQELIMRCLNQFYVSADDYVEDMANSNLINNIKNNWSRQVFECSTPWLTCITRYSHNKTNHRSYDSFICIPKPLFSYFYKAIYPEEYQIEKVDPEAQGLRIIETEQSTVETYPLLLSLYAQGELYFTKNKISVSVIRKSAKTIGLAEFFPNEKDTFLKELRATLMFPYFMHKIEAKKLAHHPDLPIQDLFYEDVFFKISPPSILCLPLILSHLSGIPYARMTTSNCTNLLHNLWLEILTYHHLCNWISIDKLIQAILRKDSGFSDIHLFSSYDYRIDFPIKNKKKENHFLTFDRLKKEFCEPFVKGALVMFASAGLLDIAIDECKPEDTSYFDWLKYVRLTDLGKYELHITDSYHPSFQTKEIKYFDVDPDYLIIRSLEESNPYETFLNDIATPIGNHRYSLSEKSFIRKCTTQEEVQQKIDVFKKFIADPPSSIWTDFFQSLIKNSFPLQPIDEKNFSIFKIDENNKRMIYHLNTDPELQKYIIRAEGFIILVKSQNRSEFSKRMRELGFIV